MELFKNREAIKWTFSVAVVGVAVLLVAAPLASAQLPVTAKITTQAQAKVIPRHIGYTSDGNCIVQVELEGAVSGDSPTFSYSWYVPTRSGSGDDGPVIREGSDTRYGEVAPSTTVTYQASARITNDQLSIDSAYAQDQQPFYCPDSGAVNPFVQQVLKKLTAALPRDPIEASDLPQVAPIAACLVAAPDPGLDEGLGPLGGPTTLGDCKFLEL